MKKLVILIVLIVAALFVISTDFFVNPFEDWIKKNRGKSAAPRLQYCMAGYLFLVAQRQGKAVEFYQTAFELFPGHPDEAEAHYRIGLYYEAKKDYVKAGEEYQIIIQRWPDIADKLALSQRIERFRAYSGGS